MAVAICPLRPQETFKLQTKKYIRFPLLAFTPKDALSQKSKKAFLSGYLKSSETWISLYHHLPLFFFYFHSNVPYLIPDCLNHRLNLGNTTTSPCPDEFNRTNQQLGLEDWFSEMKQYYFNFWTVKLLGEVSKAGLQGSKIWHPKMCPLGMMIILG